jgi:hypothetical protein
VRQPFPLARVGSQARRQRLQGDATAEAEILGEVHHAHASLTQRLEDAIVRDGSADHGLTDSRPGPTARAG